MCLTIKVFSFKREKSGIVNAKQETERRVFCVERNELFRTIVVSETGSALLKWCIMGQMSILWCVHERLGHLIVQYFIFIG